MKPLDHKGRRESRAIFDAILGAELPKPEGATINERLAATVKALDAAYAVMFSRQLAQGRELCRGPDLVQQRRRGVRRKVERKRER